jgi:hypothetical protein
MQQTRPQVFKGGSHLPDATCCDCCFSKSGREGLTRPVPHKTQRLVTQRLFSYLIVTNAERFRVHLLLDNAAASARPSTTVLWPSSNFLEFWHE